MDGSTKLNFKALTSDIRLFNSILAILLGIQLTAGSAPLGFGGQGGRPGRPMPEPTLGHQERTPSL